MTKTLEELTVEIEWIKKQHITCQTQLNKTVAEIFKTIKEALSKMNDDREELKEDITTNRREMDEKYQNRLPVWATLLIGLLGSAVGWLAH
jgi:gas vesicle protein